MVPGGFVDLGMQLVKCASGDHDDIVLRDVEVIVKAAQ